MKKQITQSILLLAIITSIASFIGIDGNWSGGLPLGSGRTYPVKYTFKINQGKLNGFTVTEQGNADLTEGAVRGDSLFFNVKAMGLNMLHKGRYFANGDSLSLQISMGSKRYHTTLTRE